MTTNRRDFLAAMTVGTALGCSSKMQGETNQSQERMPSPGTTAIRFAYKDPYDFGVMSGHSVTDENLVSKRLGHTTCFMAEDGKRMRWALQHMSALQRTHTIARGENVRRFSYCPIDLRAVKIPSVERGYIGFQQWLDLTETDGFMAVYLNRRDEPMVATEQYFNGLKPHSLHHLWSASKSISVGVVAIALKEGLLKREDKIGNSALVKRQSTLLSE